MRRRIFKDISLRIPTSRTMGNELVFVQSICSADVIITAWVNQYHYGSWPQSGLSGLHLWFSQILCLEEHGACAFLATLAGWLGAHTFHCYSARTFRSNETSITKSKPPFWELDSVISSANMDHLKMCYSAASWFLSHTLPLLPAICPSTISQDRTAYTELRTSFSLCLKCVPGGHRIRLPFS